MSIQNLWQKIKDIDEKHEILTVFIIILVGIGSFGLGRLSLNESTGSTVEISGVGANVIATTDIADDVIFDEIDKTTTPVLGGYVASKNSNKYHLPWCSGAQNISEANKIWFATKEEAEKSGYVPAGNCKGI